jgi:hypothetical protein
LDGNAAIENPKSKMIEVYAGILKGNGFTVEIVPASAEMPTPQLAIDVTPEGMTEMVRMSIAVAPGLESELDEGMSLVQFWTLLPVSAPPTRHAELARVVSRINAIAPLPGFCLEEDRILLCHRHTTLWTDEPEVQLRQLIETVFMIQFMVGTFMDVITAVAEGESAASTMAGFNAGRAVGH